MKKLLLSLLIAFSIIKVGAQNVVQGNIVNAKQTLIINGFSLSGVLDDSSLAGNDHTTVPTSYAIYNYIHNHMSGGSTAWSAITGKPTTLSGYGITDAYPLSGNPSNFLTGITSSNVTTALGYTPYNSTNPSGYTTQSNNDARYPQLSGSYTNPSWITTFSWSKITGTPTTLSGYGITDATLQAITGVSGTTTNSITANGLVTTGVFGQIAGANNFFVYPNPTPLSTATTMYWPSKPGDTLAVKSDVTNAVNTAVPSQTGNSGKFLTTNGTATSWAAASGGGSAAAHGLGTIFATNTWVNTTNWTANGATPTISGGKLVVTYSSGNLPSADYNYYSMLEKWNFFARIIATNTSAKIGIGIHSTNVYEGFSLYAQVDASTGYLTLTSTDLSGGTYTPSVQATSAGHLTISTNDKIVIDLERDIDSIYCYALDATTAAGWVKCAFAYNTNGTNQGTPNTGRFGFVANTGAFTVDSMGISSNELIGANMYVTCDSKGTYVANGFNSRWPQKLANFFYPSVVAIGGSEGVRDVVNRLPEIISLAPKYVLLCIGRNDVAYSYSNLYTDYGTIVSTLTAAGITVVNMNQIWENYGISLSTLSNWISTNYPTSYIDTYTPTQQLGVTGNWSDQIHPIQSEHDIVYNTVIQSRKIPTTSDFRSMVRMNVPPTVLKLDNFGANQFIGGSGNDTSTQGATDNYAWGPGALSGISSGLHNYAWGTGAGKSENTGNSNIYIGNFAGWQNEGSTYSIFLGDHAGQNALYPPTYTATDNLFLGNYSGTSITSNGSHNIFLGNKAGFQTSTVNSSLIIGGGLDGSSNPNDLVYGSFNTGQMRIGLNPANSTAFSAGATLEVMGGIKIGGNTVGGTSEGTFFYDNTKHTPYWYNGSNNTSNVLAKSILTPAAASTAVCYPNTFTILNPASSLSSMTMQLFTGSYAKDNDVVEFVAENTISGVSYYVAGGSGGNLCVNCPTTFVTGVHYKIVYNVADGNWY